MGGRDIAIGAPLRALSVFAVLIALSLSASATVRYSNSHRSARNSERRIRASTSLIVLHTTEAPARSSLNKLSDRGEAHYCVVENGTVYRIIDRDREAFHAGRSMWNGRSNVDSFSVGIEVVGYHDKPMPLVQLEALKELVAELKAVYRIDDAHVLCHSHVAYGAPNRWHRKSHRGRKQCGMLFAMPSVRTRLGLSARPAYDPDVRAKRLVQADPYLDRVLYGSVDTMVSSYGRGGTIRGASPTAPSVWKAEPTPLDKLERWFAGVKSEMAMPRLAKDVPGQKSSTPKYVARPTPKPALKSVPVPAAREGYRVLGTDGKTLRDIAGDEALTARTIVLYPDGRHVLGSDLTKEAAAKLPVGTRVFVGYRVGGPVSAENGPVRICGSSWRRPETYYCYRGRLIPGDKIDDKRIAAGTYIFYPR